MAGATMALAALLSFAKAAFVREIPSSEAQDISRAWFWLGVLCVCGVFFLITRARSRY